MTEYMKNKETGTVRIREQHDLILDPWISSSEEEYKEYCKQEEENENKDYISKLKQGITSYHFMLENYMQNVERFYTTQPFFYDKSGIFWFWDIPNDKWVIVDDIDLMNMIEHNLKFDGQTVTKGNKNNYIEAFKRLGRQRIPIEAHKKWVQFKGKAFSLSSSHVYTVTPKYFFTNPIPWELGETDETPVMDKLFEEWVGKENVELLYEIIAYCCYTDYPIHRIFCLVGSGSNGKSRYLALIERFLGDNICASELDDLINNRFESFKLYRKLCCVMGETNFGVLSKTSLLKKLCGQDIIGFEKKGKDPFNGHNYAKVLISSNSLPVSEDNTDGFYRRWTIINFPNQFPEGKDILETIPGNEYNNLATKCVKILRKLLDSGSFSNQGTIEHRKEKYLLASNPLSIFLKEFCLLDPTFYCNYGEFYTVYIKYLNLHKRRRVKSSEFKKSLEDEGLWVEKTSKKINELWANGYWIEGVKFKDNCAFCALFPTPPSRIGEGIGNQAELSKESQNKLLIEQSVIEETIEETKALNWDSKRIYHGKCQIEGCDDRTCNLDSYGVPYCRLHWEAMGR